MSGPSYDLVAFNRWFSRDVLYQGLGIARFSAPPAVASGPTTVRFDSQGQATVVMDVSAFETEYVPRFGYMEIFNPEARRGDSFAIGFWKSNRCGELKVTTGDGLFEAIGRIDYGCSGDGKELRQLSFSIRSGQFTRQGVEPIVYWVLPLINFTSEFPNILPELMEHPLRTWKAAPTPSDLAGQDAERFRWLSDRACRLIGFNFQDRIAFIEPLPDYKEAVVHLESGGDRWGITSVMVGHIGENSTAQDAVKQWSPFYLAPLLELLAGREIGNPWIEWRDANAQLLGRLHLPLQCPSFQPGFSAFRTGSLEGAGLLLTQAQSSPHVREPWLAGAVRNILRSAATGLIEMRAAHVFLAVETLCEQFGFGVQDLTDPLEASIKEEVVTVLKDVARRLRSLAAKPPATEQDRTIHKIADRTLNSSNKDRDFGLAAVELFQHFGFKHDVSIAETYYAASAGKKDHWAGALSHWRGTALHGGYFDFASGEEDIELILSTVFHLHDLVVRIILCLCGYSGFYQPATSIFLDPERLDWVKEDTPARRLGYEKGYRLK